MIMEDTKDIEWFKLVIAPTLIGYEITYRFYEEGDFGSLNQVIFNSSKKGGGIDFWGLGWLGIDLFDYKTEEQLMNVLIEPHQNKEKEEAFKQLQELLQE
jgi:hypothetical protein